MKSAKRLLILIISPFIFAAEESPDVISQEGAVQLGLTVQSWSSGDSFKISETSVPIEFYIPFSPKFSINGMMGYASVTGKSITGLEGITDALFSLSYYLEKHDVLFTLEFNYPGGKQEMTPDEYQTSVALSQPFYAFQIPFFGQGFNFSPGFNWAKPLSEKTVLGIGASYQLRGDYLPIEDMSEDNSYNPGDEWLVTAGLDVQTSEISVFSADLTMTGSGKDKIGDEDVFRAGQKVMAALQYKTYRNYDLIVCFLRFRSRSKAEIYGINEQIKIQPDELECIGSYRNRINPKTTITYFFEGRSFLKNDIFDGASQIGFGLSPELRQSAGLAFEGRLKYIIGKFKGYDDSVAGIEIGGGVRILF